MDYLHSWPESQTPLADVQHAYDLLVEKVVVLKLGRGREMQSGENGLRIVESSFARWLRKAVTRKIRCID